MKRIQREIEEIFEETKAIISDNHFVYNSGRHGRAYVNKNAIYLYPQKVNVVCLEIASQFIEDEIDVVCGPATGGIILSQWIAWHLSIINKKDVLSVYADKEGDHFIIKRGYKNLMKSKKVLIVEDIVTTGGSVTKVINEVIECGGSVVGLALLCNRGDITFEKVPKVFSLLEVKLESWPEEECPLCTQGVPVNIELGKGKDFLARQ